MKKEKLNHSQKLYESLRLEILNEKEEGKKFYSIRQLVIKYNLNINTVLKVLKKLELDGYLYAKKGKGYFIARNKKMKIDTVYASSIEVPLKIEPMKTRHVCGQNILFLLLRWTEQMVPDGWLLPKIVLIHGLWQIWVL